MLHVLQTSLQDLQQSGGESSSREDNSKPRRTSVTIHEIDSSVNDDTQPDIAQPDNIQTNSEHPPDSVLASNSDTEISPTKDYSHESHTVQSIIVVPVDYVDDSPSDTLVNIKEMDV